MSVRVKPENRNLKYLKWKELTQGIGYPGEEVLRRERGRWRNPAISHDFLPYVGTEAGDAVSPGARVTLQELSEMPRKSTLQEPVPPAPCPSLIQ